MDKTEKIHSLLIQNQKIDNLSLLDIEDMLIKGQIELGYNNKIFQKNINEWHTIYAFYISQKIEIPEELKKMFLYQNIWCRIDTIKFIFETGNDSAFDEELTIDNNKRGINAVAELLPLIEELYKYN